MEGHLDVSLTRHNTLTAPWAQVLCERVVRSLNDPLLVVRTKGRVVGEVGLFVDVVCVTWPISYADVRVPKIGLLTNRQRVWQSTIIGLLFGQRFELTAVNVPLLTVELLEVQHTLQE